MRSELPSNYFVKVLYKDRSCLDYSKELLKNAPRGKSNQLLIIEVIQNSTTCIKMYWLNISVTMRRKRFRYSRYSMITSSKELLFHDVSQLYVRFRMKTYISCLKTFVQSK